LSLSAFCSRNTLSIPQIAIIVAPGACPIGSIPISTPIAHILAIPVNKYLPAFAFNPDHTISISQITVIIAAGACPIIPIPVSASAVHWLASAILPIMPVFTLLAVSPIIISRTAIFYYNNATMRWSLG